MFVGTKFCGHCGSMAAPVEVLEDDIGECPRCRDALEQLAIGDAKICGCKKCDGVWMDVDTFENVCADGEKQSAVLANFVRSTVRPQLQTKISYVPCPDCGQLMNRNNFAKASGVIVDICKQHGVWFDADELPTIIEFIRKGGMEIKRQREMNEIESERNKLREERWMSDTGPRSSRLGKIIEDEVTSDTRSFVRRLFDI